MKTTCEHVRFRPYTERKTAELLYIRAVLAQQDRAIPADLDAALIERGISPDA